MSSAACWSLLFSMAAVAVVAGGAVRLRGTTLLAPACWAVAPLVTVPAVELLVVSGLVAVEHAGPSRYAAAVTVLCPMMAILGAKRPQHRAWQWVVLALLATLWLPAAKSLLLNSGEEMDLFPAWQVFLAVLVLLGPLNYLPTRNWLPSLVAAAGQFLLLAPFVPVLDPRAGEWRLPAAMVAFLVAGLVAWLRTWREKRGPAHGDPLSELNTAWFRFRDAFGAFWAVRAAQRVNQGLHAAGSCLELTWTGWNAAADSSQASGSEENRESAVDQAKRMLRTVLRRFVRRE